MAYLALEPSAGPSELMTKLLREKEIARRFVERRYSQWDENYELYRNKVKTNRLTQRQAVNIPLMKETIKTIISTIDDPPHVEWKELDGDEQKEMILQEKWNHDFDRLNMTGVDIQDKKTVLLGGRSFKKLNYDKEFKITCLDIFDVVIDPLTDPLDIESARYIIHQNIFRSLQDILADDRYTADGKKELQVYLSTKDGVIQTGRNKQEYQKKIDRLKTMGVRDADFALFSGGDVIVNLTEHHTKIWNATTKEFERRVIVYADDWTELLDETIEDLLGIDFYPFVSWTEDIETADFWSDGIADLVRTPNKILNIWFSQLVENRTLRNFQMYWYDSSIQGYTPQTYEPGPGRMLPAPGDPNKTVMPVNISGLDETLTAIEFLTGVIERGSGATSTQKGELQSSGPQVTLGEVQLAVGKAQQRSITMAKFYQRAWFELATKWYKMCEANETKSLTLHKTGGDGKLWAKTVAPGDWKSKVGYKAIVRSSSEQDVESQKTMQNLNAIHMMFPDNPALNQIIQKHALSAIDLTPQEVQAVEQAQKQVDEQKAQMQAMELQQGGGQAGEPPGPFGSGQPPQELPPQSQGLMQDVKSKMAQLKA